MNFCNNKKEVKRREDVKLHAKILINFFEVKRRVCKSCPYDISIKEFEEKGEEFLPCKICNNFLGITQKIIKKNTEKIAKNNFHCIEKVRNKKYPCPCWVFGDDAIKLSWMALEERGFI